MIFSSRSKYSSDSDCFNRIFFDQIWRMFEISGRMTSIVQKKSAEKIWERGCVSVELEKTVEKLTRGWSMGLSLSLT